MLGVASKLSKPEPSGRETSVTVAGRDLEGATFRTVQGAVLSRPCPWYSSVGPATSFAQYNAAWTRSAPGPQILKPLEVLAEQESPSRTLCSDTGHPGAKPCLQVRTGRGSHLPLPWVGSLSEKHRTSPLSRPHLCLKRVSKPSTTDWYYKEREGWIK